MCLLSNMNKEINKKKKKNERKKKTGDSDYINLSSYSLFISNSSSAWFILHPAGNHWSKWPLLNNK